VIRFGPYQLDRAQGLWQDGRERHLTPKSLAVLCTLAEHAGEVISKDRLFRDIWPDTAVSDAALTSCIQELRQVLQDDARQPTFIETRHRRGYRFCAPVTRDPVSHADPVVAQAREDSWCVGRDAILSSMFDAYRLAERGTRQVIFVTGDPGVGKTTLVQTFRTRLIEGAPVSTTWGQCVQHYGVGEPYQPLLDALTRLGRQEGARLIPLLERYSPTWLAQLPALATPEHLATLRRTSAGTTRERMLRELTDALEAATLREPLVLTLEDLHWSDTSTLDWIAAFAQRPEPARLLLIGTLRPPSDEGPEHPVTAIADALRIKGLCREIPLGGLDERHVHSYVTMRFPPASGQGERLRRLARLIHERTGGNPLFVGSVLADITARGLVVALDGRWSVNGDVDRIELGISDDVRRMISRQVDRLRPDEQSTLEVASVAGATFSTAALAAASNVPVNNVDVQLAALARRRQFVRESGQIEWPDRTISARFEFLHALYQDVLYRRVPPGRRAELHRQVGLREESAYGARAPEIAAELAMHFERCGDARRAGIYLEHAAQNARSRSAYREAQAHFERALAVLAGEPPSRERSMRELSLQIGRGAVIMAARGWSAPEAADAYSRARALSSELGDAPNLFGALWGLWLFYWGQGPLSTAHELVSELLELASRDGGDASLLQAHHAAWATSLGTGDLEGVCRHAGRGIELYRIDRHAGLAATYGSHDAGMCCRNFLSWALALRGRSADAARANEESIALSERLEHPFSMALAHFFAAAAAQTCRDTQAAKQQAAEALRIAREQDFRLVSAWALALDGWVAVEDGIADGIDRIDNALTEVRATGSTQFLPYFFGLKASAHLKHGQPASGQAATAEALAVVRSTGECFWESELYRLKGDLQLAAGTPHAAEEAVRAFLQALEIARRQHADLLVLRVAVSLSRLWHQLGRHAAAAELLTGSLSAIADDALPDVVDAKVLLAAS
jgi:DNA-binding winged helix-turn-helix (wHTH) protein